MGTIIIVVGNAMCLTRVSLLSIDEREQRLGSGGCGASHVKALPTYPKVGCGKLEEVRYELRWGLRVTRIVL